MKQPNRKPSRRGTIVHEAAMAMVLAAAILTTVVQVLAISARQTRSQQQRITAAREAGDLMEQLMARPWNQLTAESVAAFELSESSQSTLPAAQLEIHVTASAIPDGDVDRDDTPGDTAKRLSIQIGWRSAGGNQAVPVRLVAWRFPRQENTE